jgi:hypothetical protein
LRLPDSVFKAHLGPKGTPTALIKILGDSTSAVAIQKLMARICPLSSQWKWEAIPHGDDAYLVSFPTFDDLKRVDGFQMGVPDSTAQMTISIWKALDVPHKFELQQVWVHVEGVPHTVRHFLGLWAVVVGCWFSHWHNSRCGLVFSPESWCSAYLGGHDGTKEPGQDE